MLLLFPVERFLVVVGGRGSTDESFLFVVSDDGSSVTGLVRHAVGFVSEGEREGGGERAVGVVEGELETELKRDERERRVSDESRREGKGKGRE